MMTLRPGAERGHADHGWLHSQHSFSFAEYHDPAHMGFGNLRVINEDRIAPGGGFGTHGHRDMEIISYVLSGALAHNDDLTGANAPAAPAPRGDAPVSGRPGEHGATAVPQVILPGDVQRMSAGRGVMHSEFNHASDQTTHFLQIWIEPSRRGIDPGYEQKHFSAADKRGRLRLIASSDGRDGSLTVHADASLYAGLFDGGAGASLTLDPRRQAYVHLVRGRLRVNGMPLSGGDALKLEAEGELRLDDGQDAEVLVFDLTR